MLGYAKTSSSWRPGSACASTSRPFLQWRHSPDRYACAVPEDIQASLDASRPSIARIYDYWLGGKDNFRSDREEAERVLAIYPPLKQMVRQNRLFLSRSVSWLASQGIRQFLDIGSGLPTAQNTHEVAQAVDPACRVVYADNDHCKSGCAHARCSLRSVAVHAADSSRSVIVTMSHLMSAYASVCT